MSISLQIPLPRPAKFQLLPAAIAAAVIAAAPAALSSDLDSDAAVQRAMWSGGGDGKKWGDAANWEPNGVPGSPSNTGTEAAIEAGRNATAEVELASDITQGALRTVAVGGGASLVIQDGASLGNLTFVLDYLSSGGSVVTMNGGSWTQDSSGGGEIVIGRLPKEAYADKTSRFVMNGGTYQSTNARSSGRMDIGHGDNQGTASFEMNGGEFFMTGQVNFNGSGIGHAHLRISGGTFTAKGLNLDASTADGMSSLVEVTGSSATIEAGAVALHKNAANTSGSATARFVFDSKGISKIATTTLNLGEGAEAGVLEVDVSNLSNAGSTGYVLFDYAALTGAFGSVRVTSGETLLKERTSGSLLTNEYTLSYGGGKEGGTVRLFFRSQASRAAARPIGRP